MLIVPTRRCPEPLSRGDSSRHSLSWSHHGGSLHATDAPDLGIQDAILTGRIGAERQGNAANHCHIGQHRPSRDHTGRAERPQAESRIALRFLAVGRRSHTIAPAWRSSRP